MLGPGRRISSLGVALAASSFVMTAHAAPPNVHVDWPTVAGCPDAKTVTELAARAMKSAGAVETVLARVAVEAPSTPGETWHVHLRTRTIRGAGERTLEAGSCAELARATALLVALAATWTNAPAQSEELTELMPRADRVPDPGEEPPARPFRLPRRAPQPVRAAERRFTLSAGSWAGSGLLPSLAWGPSASGAYELGPWSARVMVRAALPQDESVGTLGATFDALGAAVDLCRVLPLTFVAFSTHACAGLGLDAIRARGKGPEPAKALRGEALAFLGIGTSWSPAPHLHLGLDVRAGPSLLRPSFAVESALEGTRRLHQASAVRIETSFVCGFVF